MNSAIVDFYLGKIPYKRGYTIDQIWNWNYEQLEDVHDYIQWLFPLTQPSNFNRNAPILTQSDIEQFHNSDKLKSRALTSFKTMLQFYGLQCLENDDSLKITPSDTFKERKLEWLNWGDHNHLRITRILTSLRLMGLENYAIAFFQCLENIYHTEKDNIDARSFAYWKNAVTEI